MHPTSPDRAARCAYTAPRLKTYGNLVALTLKNGGTNGMNDGGNGPDKTGF